MAVSPVSSVAARSAADAARAAADAAQRSDREADRKQVNNQPPQKVTPKDALSSGLISASA